MTIRKKLLISLALVLVLVAAYFGFVFKQLYTPTEGPAIGTYDNPRKAVLVIDVQEDFSGLNGRQPVPFPDSGPQIEAINRIIESARKSGTEVAYIRQIFKDQFLTRLLLDRAIEGRPGAAMDARVDVINENDFTKPISDAFSNPALDGFLVEHKVDELYLTGLDAAYCVYYTALGALNRGYRVTVVTDAVMTTKDMDKIITRYAGHGINVTTSAELLAKLSAPDAQ